MIPYATLEVATAALGRGLTWFEIIWFDYSATKSNFYIYCHTIFILFLVYTLVPLFWVLVELSGWFKRYKIHPKVKYSVSDIFRGYKEVTKNFFLVVSTFQLVFYPAIEVIGIKSGLPLPSLTEVIAQLVVYFLLEDYSSYWIHRTNHNKWPYDNIHYFHHQFTDPIAYDGLYIHWIEIFLEGIPAMLGPLIAPCQILTLGLWLGLRLAEVIENHSGYDFPWALTKLIPFYGGAEYHDYHHYVGGQSRSNFATVFTYCDYIYGTDKGYQIHKKLLRQAKES